MFVLFVLLVCTSKIYRLYLHGNWTSMEKLLRFSVICVIKNCRNVGGKIRISEVVATFVGWFLSTCFSTWNVVEVAPQARPNTTGDVYRFIFVSSCFVFSSSLLLFAFASLLIRLLFFCPSPLRSFVSSLFLFFSSAPLLFSSSLFRLLLGTRFLFHFLRQANLE